MDNYSEFSNSIKHLLKSDFKNISDFYESMKRIGSAGLYALEDRPTNSRILDLGPQREFRFIFASEELKQKTLKLVKDSLMQIAKEASIEKFWVLLFASVFDDWTHDDQLQEAVYGATDKKQVAGFLDNIILRLSAIDWKTNFVINDEISSISGWDHLFRSLAHCFPSNNVIGVLVYAIQKARDSKITTALKLPDLLKARLLFDLSLDDYLSVFINEKDVEFICGFLFCGHAFHTPKESLATERVLSEFENYSQDSTKLENLIKKIFTAYYYKTNLKNEVTLSILNIIAEIVGQKVKDESFELDLGFRDYSLYPRITPLFAKIDESVLSLSTDEVANHITKTFIRTLSKSIHFVEESDPFEFPFDFLSKTNQEAFAYILHSILNCSDDVFKQLEKSVKKFTLDAIPYFFGRYHAQKLATKSATSLYLIMLSISWLTDDVSSYSKRYNSLIGILNKNFLEAYSNCLVPHLKSYNPKLSFPDEISSFFSMMIEAKKENKLKAFDLIAKPIENKIPLEWPWQNS